MARYWPALDSECSPHRRQC